MRKPDEIIKRKQAVDKIIHENQYGEKIYHYTSVASLIGILSKKELWLGNTANMNNKTEYPFVVCFSELNDNAAQWERYADDAHGVCIVFNTSAFLNLTYYIGAIFSKVFYKYNIKKHSHYKILKDYFNTGILKKAGDEKEDFRLYGTSKLQDQNFHLKRLMEKLKRY